MENKKMKTIYKTREIDITDKLHEITKPFEKYNAKIKWQSDSTGKLRLYLVAIIEEV